MKTIRTILTLSILAVCVACGGKPTTTNNGGGVPVPAGKQLDPQGNWVFTMTAPNTNLVLTGQLYELVPPAVTSVSISGPDVCTGQPSLQQQAFFGVAGTVSGTNDITITLTQQRSQNNVSATYTLTGTIAPDQQSITGTWASTNTNGCTVDTSGSFTATEVPPVTGTWASQGETWYSGYNNGAIGVTPGTWINPGFAVTMNLTENTDQTSPNMGQVTGTISMTDANIPCFSGPLTITTGSHIGGGAGTVNLSTAPDANGAVLFVVNAEMLPGPVAGMWSFSVQGGYCNNQTFEIQMVQQ